MTMAWRWRAWQLWLAHKFTPISVVFLASRLASELRPDDTAVLGFAVAMLVLLFGSMTGDSAHDAMPCLHCVARFPSNGEADAVRCVRWLRHYHFHQPYLTCFCLGLCVWGAFGWHPLTMAVFVGLVLNHYSGLVHRRLVVWCPWCHGWDDAPTEAPVPVGDGTKVER